MPIFAVNDLGNIGVVKDLLPHELAPNAFSEVKNILFRGKAAKAAPGLASAWAQDPPIVPYAVFPVAGATAFYWLYCGTQKIYVGTGGVHTNITRQTAGVDVDYTGAIDQPWIGGLLSGLPVVTNGVDLPQVWSPISLSQKMVALPNWPSTATCKVIKPFKTFLVALNVTKSGDNYPHMVKWSHEADPGSVPISWDETSTLYDAGEYDTSDTPGHLLDCVLLRDINILYKEDSVLGMQYVGGTDIFRFFKMFHSFGLLSPKCAIEFTNGKHFVVTQGDAVVHDGQNYESILIDRDRRWLFNNIDSNVLRRCFVVRNLKETEVWFCFVKPGETSCSIALVWNWSTGATGFRDLPNVTGGNTGLIVPQDTSNAWSGDSAAWSSDGTTWGDRSYSAVQEAIMFGTTKPSLLTAEQGNKNDGTILTVTLERTGIGIPLKQQLPPDFTILKFFKRMWPRIEGTSGGVVICEAGVQQEIGGAVRWLPAQNFTIGTSKHIDFRGCGRLLAVRFSSSSDITWQLLGYELDVKFGGNF